MAHREIKIGLWCSCCEGFNHLLSPFVNSLITVSGLTGLFITIQQERETEGSKAIFLPAMDSIDD